MKYVPGAQSNNTKKELGQHWLHDDSVLDSIVDLAEISSDDNVLEIGPGLGTLTQKLVDTKASITALEFDQDLIKGLIKKFTNCNNIAIVEGDIRTYDYNNLPSGYKIAANIPYYLTSYLIRAISETSNPPELAVLLVQKEVAERLCANPGQMSILSVTAQFYFECSLGIVVPAKLFTPPPKVDSQVVLLKSRSSKLFDVDEKDFFRLVKAGFSEKRKKLRNSLSGGLAITKEQSEELLIKSNIDPMSRAQQLSLAEWYDLFCNLQV